MNEHDTNFRRFNADLAHQRLAGVASWAAFSARWRARQGLPLLHPLDVQYLTPQDFCNARGQPLSPTEQRRLFRQYVEAAMHLSNSAGVAGRRRPLPLSADIAYLRSDGCVRSGQFHQHVVYGRADIGPYEHEAFCPTRPYGIPVTSSTVEPYWLAISPEGDEDENGDESWIAGYASDEAVGVSTERPEGVNEWYELVMHDEG
jgi:hypothetical protein